MILSINKNHTIADVQRNFTELFPYLKVQFFKKQHKQFEGSHKKEVLPDSVPLSKLNASEGSISITGDLTVGDLEKLFSTEFGLNAQVFRKSGNSWLETTVTDNWTLKKQNEEGKELSELSRS